MSLAIFKKKSTNKYSTATKRSGKPPGGYWLPQGPFGRNGSLTSVMLEDAIKNPGTTGFSINGPHRSISVGRDMKMSKQGTRFRGQYPMGSGGTLGKYFEAMPVLNAGEAIIEIDGNQWEYVKQSVLSTKGMLEKRYRWAYNGQYPNYWVQPVYTGNQTDTTSQGLYIQNKASANDCFYDVNNVQNYVNYFKSYGPMGCQTTPARGYTMNIQQSNAPYTKTLHRPKDSSAYTLRIQQQCQNPTGFQKPFPYAVQTGTGVLRGGTSVTRVASACNTSNTYLTPPAWYTATPAAQKDNANPTITKQQAQQVFIDVVLKGTTKGTK
jgi:hypothetical protein